jgi:DNA polymerase III subunit gamma/tau
MSQALYRKWRPRLWDEVIAQEHVVQTLRNAVRADRVGHAYLFSGPRGTGKTTSARLLAKALNCLEEDPGKRPCDQCAHCQSINEGRYLDLIEIDAASNTSVDDVRELRDKINFSPGQGRFKVYIIDEVHMLSTAAFNALLKTLEEPPPHAVFILATTEVHKIPATVLSRVQRHEFRRIPVPEIVKHLRALAKAEGIEMDEEALTLIARQATGAMRDAISLLDQLGSTGRRVTLAEAQEVLGTATSAMVLELLEALLAEDPGRGLGVVQTALDAGTDARQFARQVVDYLHSLLLVRAGSADVLDATKEMREQMARHAARFDQARLIETIKLFNSAATDARSSWYPGLALELALAEAMAPAPTAASQPAGVTQPATAQPAAVTQPATTQRQPVYEELPEEPAARPAASQPVRQQQPAQRPSGQQTPASQRQPDHSPEASKPAAPAPAQPAAAAAGAAPETRTVTQADIQQQWTRISQMVRKDNKLTGAALNSCVSRVLKGNILILGFQTEVVKSKMETPENLDLLRKTIQAILGVNLVVRCVVVGAKGGQPPEDLEGDGMVNAALDLGGKIMHEE